MTHIHMPLTGWATGVRTPRVLFNIEWETTSYFFKTHMVRYEIKLVKYRSGDEMYGILTTRRDEEANMTVILDSHLYFATEQLAQVFITTRQTQITSEQELKEMKFVTHPGPPEKGKKKSGNLIHYFYFESDYIRWIETH